MKMAGFTLLVAGVVVTYFLPIVSVPFLNLMAVLAFFGHYAAERLPKDASPFSKSARILRLMGLFFCLSALIFVVMGWRFSNLFLLAGLAGLAFGFLLRMFGDERSDRLYYFSHVSTIIMVLGIIYRIFHLWYSDWVALATFAPFLVASIADYFFGKESKYAVNE